MRPLRIPIRAVFYREDGRWFAHCLELDLMGDGQSQAEALGHLRDAIASQVSASIENQNAANLFTPAEPRFFEMYAAGSDVAVGRLDMEGVQLDSVTIEAPQVREYVAESESSVGLGAS